MRPRFIYITGCDGTGKSTQARLLMEHLKDQGVLPVHLWLRFPFLFSLPLLVFARRRGYSWSEETNGVRHGYWNFGRSRLLRTLLPWTLLIDAAVAAIYKIYLPLWRGKIIICERFVLDMLVDLAVAFEDEDFYRRIPGKLYSYLIPCGSAVVVLDLDVVTARQRRIDLRYDWRLETRLEMFRQLATSQHLLLLSNESTIQNLSLRIWQEIDGQH